jgi:methyl-accepting chemotaxis protein
MLKWYVKDAAIGRKIQIGYGLVVGAVGLAALYAASEISKANEMGGDYRATARTNSFLGDAEVKVLEVRIEARDYANAVAAADPAKVAEARQAMQTYAADAAEYLDKAAELATTDEIREQIVAIKPSLSAYLAAAMETGAGATERRSELAAALMRDLNTLDATVQGRQDELGPQMSSMLELVSTMAMVFALMVLLIGSGLALILSNVISNPLRRATESMEGLAGGNLDIVVEGTDRGDDAGRLARALQVFKNNALEMKRLEAQSAADRVQNERDRKEMMNKLAGDFERQVFGVVDAVAAASTELEASAASLTRTAGDSAVRADQVARAADVSAANVQTVASASEEMAASASEIASQVSQANDVSRMADQKARDADQTVRELRSAAQRIGEVIDLITEIASQTNLLALNATIEAARAGEAGRGFAVVAAEVKRLAEQTAKATEDISAQVAGIQSATDGAVQALGDISQTISEINHISVSISASVEEQTAAVREISRNTAEVAEGTRDVTSAIGAVRQGASETGAAAEQSLGAAKELGQQANLLRQEVRRFIDQIRAA